MKQLSVVRGALRDTGYSQAWNGNPFVILIASECTQ